MKPLLVIIMDGLGMGKAYEGNAVLQAKTPALDRLWTRADKKLLLGASGSDVGLPSGVAGNSEVGHLNIGAGTVVYQMVSTINDAISDGTFEQNEYLRRMIAIAKQGKNFHIIGLLSAAGVHSDIRHMFAILDVCRRNNVNPYIHIITDGRDTPRFEGKFYLEKLKKKIRENGVGVIASVSGRYYAMDRNNAWDRIQLAYNAITGIDGNRVKTPEEVLEKAYNSGDDDETIIPSIIVGEDNEPIAKMKADDLVVFYNFREDRARQLTKAFVDTDEKFTHFPRPFRINTFLTMSGYEEGLPVDVMFRSSENYVPISDLLSKNGINQYRTAETEKYAHVTYFFNGGREQPAQGENFLVVPSPKIKEYADMPEMSAYAVTEKLLSRMEERVDNLYLVNIANPDMVGHSGKLAETINAVEVTDRCIYFLVRKMLSMGGRVIITADHGNAEQMIDPITNSPDKNHTLNLVPFIYVENPDALNDNVWGHIKKNSRLVFDPNTMQKNGILSDVSATILGLLETPGAPSTISQNLLEIG